MRKEYKILVWVIVAIIIIYLIVRLNKGYFSLGYIPLLGYQSRQGNTTSQERKPNTIGVGGGGTGGCKTNCETKYKPILDNISKKYFSDYPNNKNIVTNPSAQLVKLWKDTNMSYDCCLTKCINPRNNCQEITFN